MPLVFNMFLEEYDVRMVMRQFGLYQESFVPVVHTVTPDVHR
jgi:hypothetical protein